MNEELDYAEMLEIPVETVTVNRRERKKHKEENLAEELVDRVNERMETDDPAYAESTLIEREPAPTKKQRRAHRVLIAEFIAVCALCVTIFLTNIFLTDSAINTFVRGLFQSNTAASQNADTRGYKDFALTSLVNDSVNAEIAVSNSGVLSFTAKCSVYPPCEGKIAAVNGDASTGYTVEIKHSDCFSTIMSGLDTVYLEKGDTARANLPLGFSDGEGEIRVMFYESGALISSCTVEGNTLSWS